MFPDFVGFYNFVKAGRNEAQVCAILFGCVRIRILLVSAASEEKEA